SSIIFLLQELFLILQVFRVLLCLLLFLVFHIHNHLYGHLLFLQFLASFLNKFPQIGIYAIIVCTFPLM
ncbi:hypothetical protein C2G38_2085183, partial [Gigaspora rosea]